MNDQTLLLGANATWWGAFGAAIAAIATIVAVWVSVNTANKAREDEKAAQSAEATARADEATANERAREAEERFRQQQLDYERTRDAELRQTRQDAEAVRLFDLQARHVKFYSVWSPDAPLNDSYKFLAVEVTNGSAGAIDNLTVEFYGRAQKWAPEGWTDFPITSTMEPNTIIYPSMQIVRPADDQLPPMRIEFTDENFHRWQITDSDHAVTLLTPRSIQAATNE